MDPSQFSKLNPTFVSSPLKCVLCEGSFSTESQVELDVHLSTAHGDVIAQLEDDYPQHAHNVPRPEYLDIDADTAFDIIIDPRAVDTAASSLPSLGKLELSMVDLSLDDYTPTVDMPLGADQHALVEVMYDMDRPLATRIAAFEALVAMDPYEAAEIIHVMNYKMFTTKSSYVFEFLTSVLTASSIDVMVKHMIALNLYAGYRLHEKREDVFRAVVAVVDNEEMPTVMRVDAAVKVVQDIGEFSSPAKTHAMDMLERIFHSKSPLRHLGRRTDASIRFSAIRRLSFLPSTEYRPWIEKNYMRMTADTAQENRLRLIAAQSLLYLGHMEEDTLRSILGVARTLYQGAQVEYDVRADAADVVVNFCHQRPGFAEEARQAHLALHTLGGRKFHIYNDAQNVHTESLRSSALKILEYLESKGMKLPATFTVYTDLWNRVYNDQPDEPMMADDLPEEEKARLRAEYDTKHALWKIRTDTVNAALTRISLDTATYGRNNRTLEELLVYIWAYAEGHQYKDGIRERMLDELSDASGMCSTGHAYRILNCISGFDDAVSMQISEEERFMAKVHTMLNNHLQHHPDQEFVVLVLDEMANPTKTDFHRGDYSRFMYDALTCIEPLLKKEYEGQMDETDFAMYMRKAWLRYDDPDSAF